VQEVARRRWPGRGVQSVELQLDAAGDALVTGLWQRLVDAGLPSQGRHRSPSNRPHITLVAVPDLPAGAELALAEVVAGRLPVEGIWGELTLFGSGPWSVVWRVDASPHLLDLQARVAEVCAVPADQLTAPSRWTPHVTLARRVAEADLPTLREVVGGPIADAAHGPLVAPVLRRWDGAARREWPVGQSAGA
jgi:2'-5' RNA ligase